MKMNDYIIAYGILIGATCVFYWSMKLYFKYKSIKSYRAQLIPGLTVSILLNGHWFQGEIVNIHKGLVFIFFTESGLYSYVDPSNIFPYDY